MAERYWLETLGCPKNQVDSDKLAGTLRRDGYEPAASAQDAAQQNAPFEAATVQVSRDISTRIEKFPEYGVGFRYQIPLTHALIFRADGIYDMRVSERNEYGYRTELRLKF